MRFIEKYNKPYKNGTDEFQQRFEVFKANLLQIEELNKPYRQDDSAVFGITEFSDMTQTEFKERYLSDLRLPTLRAHGTTLLFRTEGREAYHRIKALPQTVDWRKKGAVTAVKNQGTCGACWAFAAAELIESAYSIKHNVTAPSLAVQELIDCSDKNYGCKGGDICLALDWVKVKGITTEQVYPLTDKDGVCQQVSPEAEVVKIIDFSCPSYVSNENAILDLLATRGPVSVAVDASTWNNYVGGIIRFHCEDNINHAVQIVGYDLTGPVPYYIVRNSWGTGFGLDGYIYIKIGGNLCGIAQEVSSVTVV